MFSKFYNAANADAMNKAHYIALAKEVQRVASALTAIATNAQEGEEETSWDMQIAVAAMQQVFTEYNYCFNALAETQADAEEEDWEMFNNVM
jgi:mannose/fructose/N-acetylgalactosamine-specific phosphotransferase system component IIC